MIIRQKIEKKISLAALPCKHRLAAKHIFFVITLLMVAFNNIKSQQIIISGYVQDQNTGEKLIGANIFTSDMKHATVSNNYGYFSIKIPVQNELNFSYVGFKKYSLNNLINDTLIVIKLSPIIELEEVEIFGKKENIEFIGSNKLEIKQIKSLPVIAGETDILKTIQLLPGVQGGIEGTSGFHVRGSSPDQNLILVDGVPVYNVNHLFGVFSVFNTEAINNAELYKSIFPARYGGRIASVLDINMKEGSKEKFHGNASIGLISSKILLEGPLKSSRTSYLFTARRTYFDIFSVPILWFINDKEFTGGYYFYDLNAKINHTLNDKNRFYLSLYGGKDKYYMKGNEKYFDDDGYNYHDKTKNNINWGNITSQFRWNKLFGQKLFSNLSVIYSRYEFNNLNFWNSEKTTDTTRTVTEFSENQLSSVNDIGFAFDFDYYALNNYKLKYGIKYTNHIFRPGNEINFITDLDQSLNVDTSFSSKKYISDEINMYLENEVKFGIFKANIGLRYTYYSILEKKYNTFEPRVLVDINFLEGFSFQTGFSKNYQFLHLLTNSTVGFPTDQWVPVTENIKPVEAKQISSGLEYFNNNIKADIAIFYKEMKNLLEFKEGAGIADWEEKVTQGNGKAYGIEFYVGKEVGNTTGWIAYTLSYSNRTFYELNFGKEFPYKYDRRHDLKIVYLRKLGKKWDISANWVLTSGYAYTLALEKYQSATWVNWNFMFNGYIFPNEIDYIEYRNNMRMPVYHRLDIGANYSWIKKERKRQLSFGAYNVYNRLNPIYLEFFNGDIYQKSILPILPYISYSIDF
jgi:hypothetical protein